MSNLTTITGDNSYACRQKLKAIKSAFKERHGDFAYQQIDCREASFEEIKQAILNQGLFSSSKLVILGDPSANKEFIENFEDLLSAVPDTVVLVIFDQNLDKRTSLYKFLKKHSDFKEFTSMDKSGLVSWAGNYVKDNKGKITRSDLVYLAERVGSDQQLLKNEIDKLLLYNPEITKEAIDLLTVASPQSSIFDLIDAAFAGNFKKANQLYDEQRALKVEPQNIMAMITWQLHILALIKTAGSRSSAEIAKDARLSPFTVSKSERIAKKMTYEQLKSLVNGLAELDYQSKTKTLDLDEGLKNYLIQLGA